MLSVAAIWLLSALAAGTGAITFAFSDEAIRRSFHRFNFITAAVLWLIVVGMAWGKPSLGYFNLIYLAVALAGTNALLAWLIYKESHLLAQEGSGVRLALQLFSVLVAILVASAGSAHHPLVIATSLLTAAFLLGAVHTSMILGHWYLIMRNLSFEHLVKASKLFLIAVVVRTAWTAAEFLLVDAATRERWIGPDAMFVLMRVVWGLAMPLVLAIFTLRLAKTKNNQAATGMLYVCEFCVLGGEAIAAYLRM